MLIETGSPKRCVNSTKALKIPTEAGQPTATDTITESLNLPASATALNPANLIRPNLRLIIINFPW